MTRAPNSLATLCRVLDAAAAELPGRWDAAGADPALEWAEVVARAAEHRVLGLLYLAIEKSPAPPPLDPVSRQEAKRAYLRQWSRNERLAAAQVELGRELERRRIDALFAKGLLLSSRLYGSLDARAVSDVDVLVRRPESMAEAERCLRDLGYVRRSRVFLSRRLSRFFTHHFEYWRGDLAIELHWTLQRHPGLRLDPVRMWSDRESVELAGVPLQALSLADELLCQALSVPVDLQIGKLRLRPFFEIRLLLRRLAEPEAAALATRAAREGTARMMALAFAVVGELFGTDARLEQMAAALGARSPHPGASAIVDLLAAPPPRSSWRHRRDSWRLFDQPLLLSSLWWAVSLPARVLAYPTQTRRTLGWS